MDLLLSSLAQAQPSRGVADMINDLARTPLSTIVIFIAALTVLRMAIYPYLHNTLPHKRMGLFGFLRFINELADAFVYAGAFVFLLIRPFCVQTFRIPSGSMWPTLYVGDFIVANKAVYRYTDPKFGDIVVFRPPVEAVHADQLDANGDVNVDFIKRLIGLPGDTIEMRDGVLYRNGEVVADRFKHFGRGSNPGSDGYSTFTEETDDEAGSDAKRSFKFVNYNGMTMPVNYFSKQWSQDPVVNSISVFFVAAKYAVNDPLEGAKLLALPAAKIPAGYYFFMGDNRNNSSDGRCWGLVPRNSIIGRSEFIWLPPSRMGLTR